MEADPNISAMEALPAAAPAIASPWRIFWQRLRRQKIALAGGIILVILYVIAFFASFIAPYNYERQDRDLIFIGPMLPRVVGGHLAVQRYEQSTGLFKYAPIGGEFISSCAGISICFWACSLPRCTSSGPVTRSVRFICSEQINLAATFSRDCSMARRYRCRSD